MGVSGVADVLGGLVRVVWYRKEVACFCVDIWGNVVRVFRLCGRSV